MGCHSGVNNFCGGRSESRILMNCGLRQAGKGGKEAERKGVGPLSSITGRRNRVGVAIYLSCCISQHVRQFAAKFTLYAIFSQPVCLSARLPTSLSCFPPPSFPRCVRTHSLSRSPALDAQVQNNHHKSPVRLFVKGTTSSSQPFRLLGPLKEKLCPRLCVIYITCFGLVGWELGGVTQPAFMCQTTREL